MLQKTNLHSAHWLWLRLRSDAIGISVELHGGHRPYWRIAPRILPTGIQSTWHWIMSNVLVAANERTQIVLVICVRFGGVQSKLGCDNSLCSPKSGARSRTN